MWQTSPSPPPHPMQACSLGCSWAPVGMQSGGVAWGLGEGGGSQERSTVCPGVSGALEAARTSPQEPVGWEGLGVEERSVGRSEAG